MPCMCLLVESISKKFELRESNVPDSAEDDAKYIALSYSYSTQFRWNLNQADEVAMEYY